MLPNTRPLEAFVRVYRLGSATLAAREMHLTQPAVSVLIRRLESSLDTRLFSRVEHSLRPTPAADLIIENAERALSELQHIVDYSRAARKHGKTHVSVAVTPSVATGLMPSVLRAYKADHPHVVLALHDVAPGAMAQLVADCSVDFGIATITSAPGIALTPLAAYHLIFVDRCDSPIVRRRRLDWKAIGRAQLIGVRSPVIRPWIEECFARKATRFAPYFEVAQFPSAIAMVQQGHGCTIVPSYLPIDFFAMGLKARVLDDSRRELMLLQRPGEPLSPHAADLVTLIGKELATILKRFESTN